MSHNIILERKMKLDKKSLSDVLNAFLAAEKLVNESWNGTDHTMSYKEAFTSVCNGNHLMAEILDDLAANFDIKTAKKFLDEENSQVVFDWADPAPCRGTTAIGVLDD